MNAPVFRDENPYESPIIRAELVEYRPGVAAKKRNPLLALLFLIAASPLLIGSILMWYTIYFRMMEAPIPFEVMFGLSILFAITLVLWVVPLLCTKELLLWVIRR